MCCHNPQAQIYYWNRTAARVTGETEIGTFQFGINPYVKSVKQTVRGAAKWQPVIMLPPKEPVHIKQYWIPGGQKELGEMVQELLREGIIRSSVCAFISPVWSIQKLDGSRQMTVDYQELNKWVPSLHAAVPDMVMLLEDLSKNIRTMHGVVDLANTFFSIAIALESQDQFTFSWEGQQYTFQALP